MKCSSKFSLLILLVSAVAVAPSVVAQVGESEPTRDEVITKVFRLQYLHPAEAGSMLRDLYGGKNGRLGESFRYAAEGNSNSLIAVGSTETLELVEAMLARLDVAPSRQSGGGNEAVVLELKHTRANAAARALATLQLKMTRIMPDEDADLLIVSGPESEVRRVVKMVETLENRRSALLGDDLAIRVVWLVDKSLVPDEGTPVPEDLRVPIAKLAQKMGAGALRTAAQMVISTGQADARSFKATGSAALENPCRLQLTGALDSRNSQLEIDIEAHDTATEQSLCSLSTRINAGPGHPVILGMTTIRSKTCLVVVEIVDTVMED